MGFNESHQLRGRPLDIRGGGGGRKNFEINQFLLKNGENKKKIILTTGEKNIFTQAPCISSVTQNVKRNIFASREREKKFCVALTLNNF